MQSNKYPLAVIIPTYNRAEVLKQCLTHLENQTWKGFEVVVVDDGSTDSTLDQLKSYADKGSLHLRYTRTDNGGPARARNHAVSLIDAPICLMIGDDIFASPAFVADHLQLHIDRPDPSVAGLGLTRWSDVGQTVTPFMKWLDTGGLQFHYAPLIRGEKPDWRHFYTSNLSVKTEVLRQFPFDESFPYAAMEDMELACRIEARRGLDLVFLQDALAYHLHPTTFLQACQRMVRVGESTMHFDLKWPGKRIPNSNSLKRALQNILLANRWALPLFTNAADWSLKIVCPNYLMSYILSCHFMIGYGRRHSGT